MDPKTEPVVEHHIEEHLSRKFHHQQKHTVIIRQLLQNNCLHEEKVYFSSFLALLKKKINIPREIAIVNDKITVFYKAWKYFVNFFPLFFFHFCSFVLLRFC